MFQVLHVDDNYFYIIDYDDMAIDKVTREGYSDCKARFGDDIVDIFHPLVSTFGVTSFRCDSFYASLQGDGSSLILRAFSDKYVKIDLVDKNASATGRLVGVDLNINNKRVIALGRVYGYTLKVDYVVRMDGYLLVRLSLTDNFKFLLRLREGYFELSVRDVTLSSIRGFTLSYMKASDIFLK